MNGVTPLPLGDSDTVQVGETVYVAGNPKGLEGTVSDGLISGRRDRYTKKERLQMTAPISPRSSGGPVLNHKGKVIGVSVSAYHPFDGQNLNFAVPSNALKALLLRSGRAKPLSPGKPPVSADTYFQRGHEKARLGDYKGAVKDFSQAIRLKPNNAFYYYIRGYAKDNLEQFFAAIADYDTAIRLETSKSQKSYYYWFRGDVKLKLGQHFAAIADYDIAIRLNSENAPAYLNRGIAKADLGRHFDALTDFDNVIRIDPDDASFYFNRGCTKQDLRQHFSAIADYDVAIRLKPDYASAYCNRGIAKKNLRTTLRCHRRLRHGNSTKAG